MSQTFKVHLTDERLRSSWEAAEWALAPGRALPPALPRHAVQHGQDGFPACILDGETGAQRLNQGLTSTGPLDPWSGLWRAACEFLLTVQPS